MANFIPKIQYLDFTLTGTTAIGSPIITAVADTTSVQVGMTVTGTGIPADSTVQSFDATTITIDNNATANGSPTLSLFFLVEYDLPPEGDNLRERERGNVKRTVSTNGSLQHQFNYREEIINPKFTLVTQAILDTTRTFMETHALEGKSFKYFESKDEASFRTVTLNKFEFRPARVFPNDSGGFFYDFDLTLRRTL
jgi:hypothetical protein